MLEKLNPFDLFDAEAARIDAYFATLDHEALLRPSRCTGWTVRDVLAHLAGEELYNQACLNDNIPGALAELERQGIEDLAEFNEWSVESRRSLGIEAVLAEWREKNGDTRRRMRELGRDAELPTMAGPYPVGLQTFHYASEYATHADDVGAPVSPDERSGRTQWRVAFGRFALAEQDSTVNVDETSAGRLRVRVNDVEAELSPEDFVNATVHRLPDDHPLDRRLVSALVCLA